MFIRPFALRPAFLGSASLIALLISAQSGMANPDGGTVEAGTATIETTSPDTLLITQQTNKAIINWQNFDIGVNETTRFVLPGQNSVTLNRDFSGDPSEILGTLQSNGRFYLINRSGILFGRNARVDVGGLVATTHDIRSDDFMAGRLEFNIPGDPGASVINYGSISINDYGVGAFVAPHVRNDGVIVANMGKVALASANGFTLDLHGDRLISFLIENPNDHQIYDANGNPISAFVENMGTIVADGGQVVLTASAARGVVDSVINTDGVIQANTVAQRGGKIILGGGTTGRVRTSGRIVARGNDAGERGGEITIAGEKILADAFAVFDAAGRAGGGKFMLGGDYRGGNTTNDEIAHLGIELEDEQIQTAKLVVLEEGAQIDVSAIEEGDGGKLIVWSDEATFTAADLSARGGSISGDGGFIETSGKYLQVEKAADASAANGEEGTWLLDPLDITIDDLTDANGDWTLDPSVVWSTSDGGSFTAQTIYPTDTGSIVDVELIESGINNGSNVVVTTYGTSGSDDGDIHLKTDIDKTSGGDARLSLIAAGDIRIDSGVEVRSTSGELTFELSAAEGRIRAKNVGRMDMNGGELILVAKDGIDFTSRRDMPDHLSVLLNNTDLGSRRRRVDIEFDDDKVKFDYSGEVADFYPGAL
ncbi:MAG: filamentous hemagglutinin N-terminal domain-containing protein, partial [Rhizobiaceae bacterium]